MQGFCRPSGTRFLFCELTPDLSQGLSYAAPIGAAVWWSVLHLHPISDLNRLLGERRGAEAAPFQGHLSSIREERRWQ
jgi:hypothetical protein